MVNGVNERRAARPRISTGRMIFSDCPHKRADTYHDARSGTRGSIIQGLQYHRWRLSSVTRSRKPSSAAIHVVKHTTSQHPTSGTRKCTVTVNAYTKLLEARLPPLQNPDSVLGADA